MQSIYVKNDESLLPHIFLPFRTHIFLYLASLGQ